jgi:hypothetical protein
VQWETIEDVAASCLPAENRRGPDLTACMGSVKSIGVMKEAGPRDKPMILSPLDLEKKPGLCVICSLAQSMCWYCWKVALPLMRYSECRVACDGSKRLAMLTERLNFSLNRSC